MRQRLEVERWEAGCWCLTYAAWMGSKDRVNPTWVMERVMPSMGSPIGYRLG
jgi:hypothetical protein